MRSKTAHAVVEQRDLLAIRSISLMRATSMLRRWLRARLPIRSIWWVQLPKIIAGKHVNTTGMLSLISQSTGNTSKLDVHRGRPAVAGHPPGRAIRKSSRLSLALPSARLVQSVRKSYKGQATKSIGAAARSTCCLRGCPPTRAN